jgi:hypothetical protein
LECHVILEAIVARSRITTAAPIAAPIVLNMKVSRRGVGQVPYLRAEHGKFFVRVLLACVCDSRTAGAQCRFGGGDRRIAIGRASRLRRQARGLSAIIWA